MSFTNVFKYNFSNTNVLYNILYNILYNVFIAKTCTNN